MSHANPLGHCGPAYVLKGVRYSETLLPLTHAVHTVCAVMRCDFNTLLAIPRRRHQFIAAGSSVCNHTESGLDSMQEGALPSGRVQGNFLGYFQSLPLWDP